MSETVKDLRAMSLEDLITKHDQLATYTQVGTGHYLAEIARRDTDNATNKVVSLTRWIAIMTLVMMAATIVNVILFVLR